MLLTQVGVVPTSLHHAPPLQPVCVPTVQGPLQVVPLAEQPVGQVDVLPLGQAEPSPAQLAAAAYVLPAQLAARHGVPAAWTAHAEPFARHAPVVPQVAAACVAQAEAQHVPLTQCVLTQSLSMLQVCPLAWLCATHAPPWQKKPARQSASPAQVVLQEPASAQP
jgi:hypothetical protein